MILIKIDVGRTFFYMHHHKTKLKIYFFDKRDPTNPPLLKTVKFFIYGPVTNIGFSCMVSVNAH